MTLPSRSQRRGDRSGTGAIGLATFAVIVTLALELVSAQARPPASAQAKPVFPGAGWERITSPESVGYSTPRLQALRAWLQSLDTTSMVVAVGGRVLFEYGDQAHLSYLASVRKSVLAILYGKYVENGTIPLNRTLKELDFTDVGGLLPRELEATIENVITARSGIYHPASNSGDDTASAPPRGSQRPGTYQLYNNWDFNAAGAIFEKLTGRDIYDALESDLARPIGMQDFDRSKQTKSGDLTRSNYPAYHMWLSVRDMARVGLLVLRQGDWAGNPIASREWVRRISSLVTPMNEMNPPGHRALGTGTRWGYGYMWWVWDAPNSPGPFKGASTGLGAGGQAITVLPELDMVVAHKTDVDLPPAYAPGRQAPPQRAGPRVRLDPQDAHRRTVSRAVRGRHGAREIARPAASLHRTAEADPIPRRREWCTSWSCSALAAGARRGFRIRKWAYVRGMPHHETVRLCRVYGLIQGAGRGTILAVKSSGISRFRVDCHRNGPWPCRNRFLQLARRHLRTTSLPGSRWSRRAGLPLPRRTGDPVRPRSAASAKKPSCARRGFRSRAGSSPSLSVQRLRSSWASC